MPEFNDFLGSLGAVLSGVAAVLALLYAARQVKASRKMAQEANALQSHREYLSLCLVHPELSSSILFAKAHGDLRSFDHIEEEHSRESERYLWFLTILLNNCEQVLRSTPGSKAWRTVLKEQIRYHHPVIHKVWPKWEKGYTDAVAGLVREALADGPEEDWVKWVKIGTDAPSNSGK
ncbi:hypothetical protein [Rhizobium sp. Leaf383]|uniref:hypothetical protein n=1 Tax=Rhizobium sp. Leaf383 TaxID=1736357 RepID=UPI00071577A9|nr:hypothetical protein [Rhizobium sp. Leaf383]KQS76425.1 hypothetical protein ASG58_11420 [Rhizobium sp. Leaf383]